MLGESPRCKSGRGTGLTKVFSINAVTLPLLLRDLLNNAISFRGVSIQDGHFSLSLSFSFSSSGGFFSSSPSCGGSGLIARVY